MRVLLSAVGSRGDVQPVVALAVRLQALGQEVRVCAAPDFGDLIDTFGISFAPIGPELGSTGKVSPSAASTPEQRRQVAEDMVAAQFEAIPAAAQGCDVIVAGGPLVIAARTVAERMGIRYVFAAWTPLTLPSPHHAPPLYTRLGDKLANMAVDYRKLWGRAAQRRNATWSAALNSHRASVGLAPVDDVGSHLFTDQPWLAADPTLAPWPEPEDAQVAQTGAWILPDQRPLSPELETFLDAGEPPVYFGLGSIRVPQGLSTNMVQAARAVGRRAIVLRGWADLALPDDEPDCLSIGEVNVQALFPRVAAVGHHGGVGTATVAALAGTPHVVIPQHSDQYYFAQRVHQLGIGTMHLPGALTTDSLTEALSQALQPDVAARAKSTADAIRTDGADTAAQLLMAADSQN